MALDVSLGCIGTFGRRLSAFGLWSMRYAMYRPMRYATYRIRHVSAYEICDVSAPLVPASLRLLACQSDGKQCEGMQQEGGADWLGVDSLEEALLLRQGNISVSLLVL